MYSICDLSPALHLVTFLIGRQRQDSSSFLLYGNETKDFGSKDMCTLFLPPVVMVTVYILVYFQAA